VVAVPLIWSVQSVHEFVQPWLTLQNAAQITVRAFEAVRTPSAEWINVAYGNHSLLPLLRQADLKLSPAFRPWHWKGRKVPDQYLNADFPKISPSTPGYVGFFDGLYVQTFPMRDYAYVDTGTERIPCQAQARGGDIKVDCDVGGAGSLVVEENFWTGWQVTRDGQPVTLNHASTWLSVDAPAGSHHFEFHYRPWDVWVGLILTMIGVVACSWLWMRDRSSRNGDRGE
jgi:hypothetical protein